MSWRSITLCKRLDEGVHRAPDRRRRTAPATHTGRPRWSPGGDTECPPATAPARRCPAHWRCRRARVATMRSMAAWSSSTSGSMSGVMRVQPARDQVGRHHALPRSPAHRRGQRGQGRLAEQHAHVGSCRSDLAHALDQLHRQQRMAAQLEEVVVAADLLEISSSARCPAMVFPRRPAALRSHVGPTRRRPAPARPCGRACRWGSAGRRPARTKALGTMCSARLQPADERAACATSGARLLGEQIGHQALVAGRVFAGDDHGFAHACAAGQARLDLAQFDAEAADLDLVVVAPQVFEVAVGQPRGRGRRSCTARRPCALNGSGTKRSAVSSARFR